MAWRRQAASTPSINLLEASIADLLHALAQGTTTSVDLTAAYLARIQKYDHRQSNHLPPLNSVHLVNPNALPEAVASDLRRLTGQPCRPLEGIPFTVKDSFKVKGLPVACASPAFKDLIATDDACVVSQLRQAGAILIGKTNTPPMMYGGMQRGIYGRAESPYNPAYLPAAFGSGSSNGSAVSTAANFAAFGIGSETVSSGRSPASNNALVAYTPSRGLISVRGSWPLYPTCDVVVPHTRSVDDLLRVLDVLIQEDQSIEGDYWRQQAQTSDGVRLGPLLGLGSADAPPSFQTAVPQSEALKGKRLGVPRMFTTEGRQDQTGATVYINKEVIDLFQQARADLEAAGAEIVETDFPALSEYEDVSSGSKDMINVQKLPEGWQQTERAELIAYAWDDFLRQNGQEGMSALTDVDVSHIFPTHGSQHAQMKFTASKNALQYSLMQAAVEARNGKSILDLPNTKQALQALEDFREKRFESQLEGLGLDALIFPAASDIARADADQKEESARHAWSQGVKYSHGNQMLRHVGIPTITVPMGMLPSKQMPMGITFAGSAYHDVDILRLGQAYEALTHHRQAPELTPAMSSDELKKPKKGTSAALVITLEDIRKVKAAEGGTDGQWLMMKGVMHVAGASKYTSFWAEPPVLHVFVDGEDRSNQVRYYEDGQWEYRGLCRVPPVLAWEEPFEKGRIEAEGTGVVLVAKKAGFTSGGLWTWHA